MSLCKGLTHEDWMKYRETQFGHSPDDEEIFMAGAKALASYHEAEKREIFAEIRTKGRKIGTGVYIAGIDVEQISGFKISLELLQFLESKYLRGESDGE